MPFEIRDLVSKCSLPVNHISAIISYNNLIDQTRFESDFDKLTGHSLQEELEDQLRIRPLVHAANVKKIVASVRSELDGIETLLSMPSSKLNNEEKQRKNSFRTIKKLFVHELSKKQQHIPVKSFSKETWDYLSVIHPVW